MTVNLQPAVTTVNLAFLAVIEKELAPPDMSAGHSLGEFSALHACGVNSKEDLLRMVYKRGELMHRESTKHVGAMYAVIGLNIDNIREMVDRIKGDGIVSVANHNTDSQIVITGEPGPVKKVAALAAAEGAKAIPLKVSGAWHSDLIKGAQEEFEAFLNTFSFNSPKSRLFFNVTADTASDPQEIKKIMAKQLCSPVRWYDIMCKMAEEKVETFAEIGPGKVLTGLLKKTLPKDYACNIYNVNDMKSLELFLKEAA